MSLTGCLKCARYSTFAMNFIVWVSGMMLLIVAIYLRMDPETNHMLIAAYADDVTLYHVICYSLIGCGAAVTFVGFLGCCSAFQESRFMVAAFFAVMFALLTSELLIGAWAFLHADEIKVNIPATMAAYVQRVYGKHPLTDEPIDFVQQSLRCCGGVDASDWSAASWANKTMMMTSTHHFPVPASCCVNRDAVITAGGTSGTMSGGMSETAGSAAVGPTIEPVCPDQSTVAASQGCGVELVKWLNSQLLIVSIGALSLLGLQFLSLCISLVLCCGMRRQSAGGYKT